MKLSNLFMLAIVFLLSQPQSVFAQSEELIRCYSVEHYAEQKAKDPTLPSISEFEEWLAPLVEAQKKEMAAKGSNIITIPCVVHVLHNGEPVGTAPNITDAQAISQIEVMNEDFGRTNPDADQTRAEFLDVAADLEIRFVMAQTDPDGKATNGVNHVNIGQDGATRDDLEGTIKPNTIWDATRYLNMWSLEFASPDDNLLGYAQFPDDSGVSGVPSSSDANREKTDGVVIRYNSFGTKNHPDAATFLLDAPYDLGRTATHEVGHWVGLRHTWGDMLGCSSLPLSISPVTPPTGCSCTVDDFCEDTPNSDLANYGCSLNKSSVCEVAVTTDQIENYMDYTNDECMNMFTLDQKARALTVMANSPRRKELKDSPALFPPGAYIVFPETKNTVLEGSDCNATQSIEVTLAISNPASDAATVTLVTGGTATQGDDYTLSTSSVDFAANSTDPQTITIELSQDFASEGNETIEITIDEVTTTGDALKGFAKTVYTLTITDDDLEPMRAGIAEGATIHSTDFESTSGWTEQGQFGSVNWTEGTNASVLLSAGTGGSAFITLDGLTASYDQLTTSGSRYVSPVIDTRGITNMTISFDYAAAGEQDTGGTYDFGSFQYSTDGSTFKTVGDPLVLQTSSTLFTATIPADAENSQTLYLALRWDNDNLLGDVSSIAVDNVLLTGSVKGPVDIATAVSTTATTAGIANNETVYFYDENNQVIAAIEGSSEDLGCTNMMIQSTGESTNITQTNLGTNVQAASKTVTLSPEANGSSAAYTVHLYYTQAEIDKWIADLGASGVTVTIDDFKIFKTDNTDASAATIENTKVADTTYESYDVNGNTGYRFSANFTGFSTFGGGNATVTANDALAVDLVSFTARLDAQQNAILNWEANNLKDFSHFEIQRSAAAKKWETIGKVSTHSDALYSFTDSQVAQQLRASTQAYYRLRMVNIDATFKFSNTRNLRLENTADALTAYPNPSKGVLNVSFRSQQTSPAQLEVVALDGRLVEQFNIENPAIFNQKALNLQQLPRGIYFLRLQTQEGTQQLKIVLD